MRLLVCIPTITGREEFLRRSVWAYCNRTPGVDIHIEVVCDEPTCGLGWQKAVERGLSLLQPPPDYIHFGNDDIMVGEGWFYPLLEAAAQGFLPCSRIEPAGYHLGEEPAEAPSPGWVPPSEHSYFYSDLPENQPQHDWAPLDHSALPFCSVWQWGKIGRFIPIHFGTDKWFYHRGRQEGMQVVARMDSVIFNYATQIGRRKGLWYETDLIDFDCVFAYPAYVEGRLLPHEEDPQRLTNSGLAMVRRWRKENFDPPYHWEMHDAR